MIHQKKQNKGSGYFRMVLSSLVGILGLLFVSVIAFAESSSPLKIGLVLEKSGKDDKSFNASAYRGAQRAEKELGVKVKTVEAPDNNAYESLQRAFEDKKFDLIIAIGFHQLEATRKNADRFPQQKFLLVDDDAKKPNVRSVLFAEHEGSYLVGALAALHSKTGKVGFIGGMDVPLIRRFQMGYEAGVKKINPKVTVIVNYLGVTGEAWNNPPKAKELSLDQFNRGADVIYAAAGNSGLGVFDAAEQKKFYAIGVDSNQDGLKPGRVLTSMEKKVDQAVFDTIKELKEGKFEPGLTVYGLANQGVGYTLDEYNEKILLPEARKKVDTLREEIIKGKIKVPDYYLVHKQK